MNQSIAVWLVVALALFAANLPFFNERLLLIGPRRQPKSVIWRLLELVLMWGVMLACGFALESYLGQRAPQGWEFYAATGCLFLTLASPGFVWRYLRKSVERDTLHVG
ncbi:DUF2818 family protein [Ideonella sp.]|uniref:DUF2818 family protein n=1 Tax=Ideonella sp. TaxID=1929293 RepID=UPI003BB684D9